MKRTLLLLALLAAFTLILGGLTAHAQSVQPPTTGFVDITDAKLHEHNNFARTPETDDGDRFGEPLYWTVENFGFGDEAGIDGIKGFDCLHLENWWNDFSGAGYDIKNARIYQQVTLPAGRYYLGAEYPSTESNDACYIFASESIVNTSDIRWESLGCEKIKGTSADGKFYGFYFTLESETSVYLGFQGDFTTNCSNIRVKSIALYQMDWSEFDASSASAENPIDVSYVIKNPDATRASNGSGSTPLDWTLSPNDAFECEYSSYLPTKVGASYFNKWQRSGNLTDRSMSQTVTGLPSGRYRLSVRTHSSVIAAGANLFANSDKTALNTVTESNVVSVTTAVTDGRLNFGVELVDYQSNDCKFDHFTLEYLGTDATASDYDALAAAITAFDNAVWGFETGEYAPYNNVEAFENIAAAKAIDPDGINSKLLVNLLTEKITLSAANVAEVNACAYGDFNTYETISGEDMPYGWNLYNGESNHSRIMGGTQGSENAGLAATSSGKALLLKWNSTYGESEGYTMPLKASTLYKITFKYCGWGGNTPQTHVVMTDPSGNDITLNPVFRPAIGDGHADASHWYSFTGYFVSSTAGNYKFNLNKVESGQQQIAIGDIELKTSNDVLLFSDATTMPTYAPGTYPTVRIERTISNEKWNTFVVPVSMANPDGWEVMEMESFSSNTLSFTEASSIVAGQSYMVKPTDALTYFEVSNVAVTALETNDVTVDDVTMKGVYNSGATVPVSDETHTRYAVVGGELRKVTGNATVNIKPFRAYFEVQGVSQAREILLNFDEETAISFAEQWGGAERTQLEDGKYLIDGKIIIVNNGVKYSANGQILK